MRALAAGYYDGSLSSMLAELATACRYGDPVRETTTVELLDLVLDAVRSAPSALNRPTEIDFPLLTTSPAQVVGQGYLTLSLAARTTRRRTTEQVWLPYHPLHITNPPHIIRKQAPHAPHTP